MRRRAPELGWLLVGASLAGASAPASPQSASAERSETGLKAPAADDTGPSMEFLEFLGEWEAGEGQWVDPAEVQSADWPVMSNDSADASDKGTGNAE
ncbi:MAG: hypothetical protein BMS9Abin01_0272 [Gammaproteobacteria bacterium]|nr:MAG: hypothetical protein BMS9Abin01_0272 [Gammaproteobacteria bacterium]